MNRDEFLDRVRAAAASGRAHRLGLDPRGPLVGYVGAGDDPPARLAAEVQAVGGQSYLVDDLAAARFELQRLLTEWSPRSAVVWQHPLLDQLGLGDCLERQSVEVWNHGRLATLEPAAQRAQILAADLGITSATWAIAETGSLAMASAPGRERVASLLPPRHLAIVSAAQILPDLFDLFDQDELQAFDRWPSNLVLITGPSKTGDIELQLTTGVHGPGEWHVLIVRHAS